jgi:hypothetical protein
MKKFIALLILCSFTLGISAESIYAAPPIGSHRSHHHFKKNGTHKTAAHHSHKNARKELYAQR